MDTQTQIDELARTLDEAGKYDALRAVQAVRAGAATAEQIETARSVNYPDGDSLTLAQHNAAWAYATQHNEPNGG